MVAMDSESSDRQPSRKEGSEDKKDDDRLGAPDKSSSSAEQRWVSSTVSSRSSTGGGRSLMQSTAPFCGLPLLAWNGLSALRHWSRISISKIDDEDGELEG